MFKETYGFDVDKLSPNTPIHIKDNESTEKLNGLMIVSSCDEGYNYHYENKTGTYLIYESSSTFLKVFDNRGCELKLPIKHFLGENPRMKIEIFTL
ncbi:hypothetical protein [Aquibacillus saliphilus]|uniref:hypothetical protein n=1 Tax=Aquibacillus saliphilus TaxID=1909422 RepID=UPI001CF03139|nr:hypothetical protein [Aquibacillus saliphilus]